MKTQDKTLEEKAEEFALKWYGDQDACEMACSRGAAEGYLAGYAAALESAEVKGLEKALMAERCRIMDNHKLNYRCECLRCNALKKFRGTP